jgi:hypothetical protein
MDQASCTDPKSKNLYNPKLETAHEVFSNISYWSSAHPKQNKKINLQIIFA